MKRKSAADYLRQLYEALVVSELINNSFVLLLHCLISLTFA